MLIKIVSWKQKQKDKRHFKKITNIPRIDVYRDNVYTLSNSKILLLLNWVTCRESERNKEDCATVQDFTFNSSLSICDLLHCLNCICARNYSKITILDVLLQTGSLPECSFPMKNFYSELHNLLGPWIHKESISGKSQWLQETWIHLWDRAPWIMADLSYVRNTILVLLQFVGICPYALISSFCLLRSHFWGNSGCKLNLNPKWFWVGGWLVGWLIGCCSNRLN